MDEFNRDFDPTDEYAEIDQQSDTTMPVQDEYPAVDYPPVSDTPCEDAPTQQDAFSAFEKAEIQPPVSAPAQSQTPQHTPPQYGYATPPFAPPHQGYQPPKPPYQAPPQVHQPPYQAPQPPQYQAQNFNQYGAPYSPYQQNGPAQPPQPPQGAPYNPYNAPVQNHNKKQKTPTGTKVLIGVLIGFLVLFMVAFFVSCGMLFADDTDTGNNPLADLATEPYFDEFDDFGYYEDPYFGFGQSYDGSSFEEEIILQADEGQTQSGADDKVGNTYAPDKNADGIKLEALPKDKNNGKHTAQSAYNTVTDSVVSVVCYEDKVTGDENDIVGEGTGTIISADGYIVTNSHVIGDSKAYTINIIFNNSDEYIAKVVGFDTRTDLAVLKIDAKDLTYAKFSDSSLVEVGQDIIAIGNPGGQSFQNSLTKGIVSAVDRELELRANVTYIQIDAAINPGNSGGPLCSIYGQVIGINSAKIGSEVYEGMGFAIPSVTVRDIANDLIRYGYVRDRVRIGLMGTEVDYETANTYGVPYGIIISEISAGGPLAGTDIQPYDILTAINGEEVTSFQQVFAILEEYKPGDKVTLTLYRLEEY